MDLSRQDAEVLIADIYRGDGLAGRAARHDQVAARDRLPFRLPGHGRRAVQRGAGRAVGPETRPGHRAGLEDGSARFRVPAYTPIALQPLDAEGKAVQLMRSWFTAMPGEVVSCVGCHEQQNTAPPVRQPLAATRPPAEIQPWYGPPRGFAFRREVQPVLDRHCIRCHNGQPQADGRTLCSLRGWRPDAPVRDQSQPPQPVGPLLAVLLPACGGSCARRARKATCTCCAPWEYHADTTRLVQLLRKGHYDVQLDAEAWDRLITWIDLNAPFHGNWTDIRGDEIGDLVRQQSAATRSDAEALRGDGRAAGGLGSDAAAASPTPPCLALLATGPVPVAAGMATTPRPRRRT